MNMCDCCEEHEVVWIGNLSLRGKALHAKLCKGCRARAAEVVAAEIQAKIPAIREAPTAASPTLAVSTT